MLRTNATLYQKICLIAKKALPLRPFLTIIYVFFQDLLTLLQTQPQGGVTRHAHAVGRIVSGIL